MVPCCLLLTLGETGDAVRVDVPLVRGGGDTRPRVEARLAEDATPVLAIVDLGSDRVTLGRTAAVRLGLRVRGDRAEVPWLRVGDLLVTGLTAGLDWTDELRIGVGALDGLGVAVLPSSGVVRFARDTDALLAEVGAPVPLEPGRPASTWKERGASVTGKVGAAVPVTFGGAAGTMRLRSDLPGTAVGAGVLGEARVLDGVLGLGGVTVRLRPTRDESIADPRPDVFGELGADAFAFLDLAVADGRIAVGAAPSPTWTDADTLRRAWLEAEAPGWNDVRARRGQAELAALRDATGDVAGALAADAVLEPLIGDRCDLWLAAGERRLRAGEPGAGERLTRAVEALAAWDGLGIEVRDRVRYARRLPPEVSSTRQPVACERARTLLVGLPTSDAGLRAVGAWTALAGRHPGAEASRAWARRVAATEDPHALTTALLLGPELVGVALEARPDWVAGRLASAAWSGPSDPGLGDLVARELALRPGDPSVRCRAGLREALGSDGPGPPLGTEADCLAAAVLLATSRGDAEVESVARGILEARWPDLVPRGCCRGPRGSYRQTEEP